MLCYARPCYTLLYLADAEAGRAPPFGSLVLQDVDLLPDEELGRYYDVSGLGASVALHLAASWVRYDHEGFFGGVCAMRPSLFAAAGGFPNDFWGWGAEDTALHLRLEHAGAVLAEPASGRLEDLERLDTPKWMLPRLPGVAHHKGNQEKLHRLAWELEGRGGPALGPVARPRSNGVEDLEMRVLLRERLPAQGLTAELVEVELPGQDQGEGAGTSADLGQARPQAGGAAGPAIEMVSQDPLIVRVAGVASPEECQELIRLSRDRVQPSKVQSAAGAGDREQPAMRTSRSIMIV